MGEAFKYQSSWKTGEPKEAINHIDLKDMPDLLGTNTDHDTRYLNESITLASTGVTIPAATSTKTMTIRNISAGDITLTATGGDTIEETTVHTGESFRLKSDGATNWYLI